MSGWKNLVTDAVSYGAVVAVGCLVAIAFMQGRNGHAQAASQEINRRVEVVAVFTTERPLYALFEGKVGGEDGFVVAREVIWTKVYANEIEAPCIRNGEGLPMDVTLVEGFMVLSWTDPTLYGNGEPTGMAAITYRDGLCAEHVGMLPAWCDDRCLEINPDQLPTWCSD